MRRMGNFSFQGLKLHFKNEKLLISFWVKKLRVITYPDGNGSPGPVVTLTQPLPGAGAALGTWRLER